MYFLLSLATRGGSVLLLLIPAFLLLHAVYFRRFKRTATCFLLGLYFAGIYTVTGMPTVQFTTFEPNFYLIPLWGILFDVRNSILNTILFIPLGFLVPLFCGKFRCLRQVILLGLACSLFIELAQLFTYRLSDINDLLTNTLGAWLGFRMAQPILIKKSPAPLLGGNDILLSAAATAALMYCLQPMVGSWLWRVL